MSPRRRGVLGKLRGVLPGCYASAIIGGCRGPLTEEHPFSEALRRGRSVQVVVSEPDAAGMSRVTFSSPPLKMRHASAKILCEYHNGQLSPADQEAVKFQDALQEIGKREESPLIYPAERVVINGRRFAQFLSKYTVGSFVIHDPTTRPSADLVLYAFGRPTQRPIHFYFAQSVGDKPGFGRTDNAPIQRIGSVTDPSVAYVVEVAGIRTIITHLAEADSLLEALKEVVAPRAVWLNRLKSIDNPIKGEMYSVVFDWDDDPFESRLVHALP